MKKKYDESAIESYQGLSGIRAKPQMYIGHNDSHGLWTIIREVMDNCRDEALAGRNWCCSLIIDKPHIWVIDAGEGIPVGEIKIDDGRKTVSISALEAIVSKTHTGGKFQGSEGAYASGSSGTHGIGIKATNALSSAFSVWTQRDGKVYTIGFEKGRVSQELEMVKSFPQLPYGYTWHESGTALTKKDIGTIVRFTPDMSCFVKGTKLDLSMAHEWAEIASYLNPGFRIDIVTDDDIQTYYSEDGAHEYLNYMLGSDGYSATPVSDKFLLVSSKELDIAIAFTDFDGVALNGYTNGLNNPDGGLHVSGLLSIIGNTVAQYKGARQTFKPSDVVEGVLGLINVKVPSPTFNNQTKDKLIDDRVPALLDSIGEEIVSFFAKNKSLVKTLCDRASSIRAMRDEFKANKDGMRLLSAKRGQRNLPQKLMRCSSTNPKEVELFLMEGDSAGGQAASARNRQYQMILPLKGKVMNVLKMPKGKTIWDSQEIVSILQSIGYDPKAEKPEDKLTVGRIILLGDADTDGYHINLLNLTLLYRVIPDVFKRGMVYIARGYEYVIETPERNYYADSVSEMRAQVAANLMQKLLHVKGWAEVSAKGLRDMAFDPATRKLLQINLDKTGFNHLHKCMGEDVGVRRQILGI